MVENKVAIGESVIALLGRVMMGNIHTTMITEKELDKLHDFSKESDGSYCDRWEFSIIESNRFKGKWDFCHFCEVDGALYYIKTLKDMVDLKNVYKAITDKELKICI